MKYIVFSLVILGLTACGSNDSNGGGAGPKGGGREQLRKATTAAHCQNGYPASQVEGRWQTVFQSEHITMTMTFDFKRSGLVSLTNDCSFPVGSLQAIATSRYYLEGGNLVIPYAAAKEERASGMTCSARIEQGSMRYGFEGSCLVMMDPNGEKLYLTPAY